MGEWYEDRGELFAFARAMVAGNDWSASTLLELLEKPWKWSDERAAWVAAGRPEEMEVA